MNSFEQIIQRSYQLAGVRQHEMVTLEHLLAALLEDEDIIKLLAHSKGDPISINSEVLDYLNDPNNNIIVPDNTIQPKHTQLLMTVVKKAKTQSMFSGRGDVGPTDLLIALYGVSESPASYFLQKHGPTKEALVEFLNKQKVTESETMNSNDAQEVLETYCVNLNAKAGTGKIDPLIGRESEIESITQTLARRTKHNVVMTGDPGVGKTQIVEGLAKRIVDKNVPEPLLNKTIWSLDMATMVAGTKFRGDFEERMKAIIKAFSSLPDAVMFIDEIHMIMGAGNAGGNGSIDAANMLKPSLSRGEIQCIGSTTMEEYRKHFEKDRALARRFQRLDVYEPSIEDSKRILRGIAKYYEEYHSVKYDPAALDAAVDLTVKYIHDKYLPDKAIDIIDSAAAWQRIKPSSKRNKKITKKDIEVEVCRVAKIPEVTVKVDESKRLKTLDKDLKNSVYGQDDACNNMAETIWLVRSGLREVEKTSGAFLFTGPTGVGKTELAKRLAKSLDIELIRFDMSEYMEKHTISKMIGAPPGYVGFSDGNVGSGLLVNSVEKHPHCILLFDEVEKAHPDVFNILLQVMDNGMLTSSNGKTVSFRNTILIMTSNLGAQDMERNSIGFGSLSKTDADQEAVNSFFTPEFRNRLDGIIRFNKLTKADMNRVIDKFISQMNELSGKKNVSIVLNSDARDWLIDRGFDSKMGARPLARVIQENIKKPLAKEILFGKLKNGGGVVVYVKDDKLDFNYIDTSDLTKIDTEVELLKL